MIGVAVACDGRAAFDPCPTFQPPEHVPFDEASGWIAATLEENGWTTYGDKHYCPRHDPAQKGEEVTIRSGGYTELAPGVRVRLPGTAFPMVIEVLRDDRECHGNVGAVCGGGTGPYGG